MGGGGYDASGDVAVSVDDDDQGLTLSASTVALTEGGSTGGYTVRLAAAPNANVTVSVSSDDTGAMTVSPSSLTFTTTNYASVQTVTLTAVNDGDGADESVTVSNSASGGGYDASGNVTVSVDDDDQGLTVSATSVSLTEGGSTGSYTVKLDAAPNANVTVAVSSGDTGAVTASPSSLTFTTTNYSSEQTVTLTAVGDADGADESVTVSNAPSGGGYGNVPSVTLTVSVDDDDQGLTVSATSVSLTEGGSTGSYTVKLDAAPNANVTVAVSSGDTGAVTASPSSLTFTTTNYSSEQTVTLTAVGDADGADESVTVSNTASGGGYGNVAAATMTATVDDDDQGLTLSPSSVKVPEGGAETYTVKLAAQPAGTVKVAIAKASGGDADLTVNKSTLKFTTGNWSRTQTVTVKAAEETGDDSANGTATFTHTASGGGYDASADLAAKEADNDRVVGIPATLRVPEGGTATYTAKLAVQPSANVTLTLAVSGDSDLTVDTDTGATAPGNQNTLTFTTSNYATAQTVTVAAAQDGDSANGGATISHTAASSDTEYDGIPIPSVRATEADDDTAPPVTAGRLELSSSNVTVPEGMTATCEVVLTSRPSADVTVTLTRDPGGDADLAVDTDPDAADAQRTLVFTPADFSDARTVTVAAAVDADGIDGTATFTHTATGGAWTGVTATLTATERDVPAPVAVGVLPALTLVAGGAPRTVDVSGAFRGPDLSYAVHSSHEESVEASIEDAVVTLTPLRGGEARITVTARNRIGEARQSFTATVSVDRAERRALVDGLAAIGRGMLSSIDTALGARLRGRSSEGVRVAGYALESGGVEAAAPDAARGFSPDAGRAFPDRMREDEPADPDWLAGTSFVVALNADAGDGAGGSPRWTLWGRGDLQSFDSDRSSVDGETRTAWVGLDTARGDDWLLGAALSWGQGHADYAFEGEVGSGSGRLRTTLTSLHPYLRWRPWGDVSVWAAVGAGDGWVENRRDHLGRVERGDLSMLTARGGGRYALNPAAGGAELAVLGDLAYLRIRTDTEASQGSLDDVSASVGRLRIGFEGAYELPMDPGTLSPFGRVSARYDGGDGEKGSGMEVSGGVRYRNGRVSFETGGRTLWAVAGDYEESGWNLGLALEPRAGGRGLSLSLSPTWGAAQHRALEALWRPDALSRLDDGAALAGDGHGMRTTIGYGLRWPASAALLTPYAEHDRLSSGDRRTSMGVRLEHRRSRLEADLWGEVEEGSDTEAGGAGVFLDVRLRF